MIQTRGIVRVSDPG